MRINRIIITGALVASLFVGITRECRAEASPGRSERMLAARQTLSVGGERRRCGQKYTCLIHGAMIGLSPAGVVEYANRFLREHVTPGYISAAVCSLEGVANGNDRDTLARA